MERLVIGCLGVRFDEEAIGFFLINGCVLVKAYVGFFLLAIDSKFGKKIDFYDEGSKNTAREFLGMPKIKNANEFE